MDTGSAQARYNIELIIGAQANRPVHSGTNIAIARIFVRLLEDFSRDRKENVIYRVHVSPTEHAQC